MGHGWWGLRTDSDGLSAWLARCDRVVVWVHNKLTKGNEWVLSMGDWLCGATADIIDPKLVLPHVTGIHLDFHSSSKMLGPTQCANAEEIVMIIGRSILRTPEWREEAHLRKVIVCDMWCINEETVCLDCVDVLLNLHDTCSSLVFSRK